MACDFACVDVDIDDVACVEIVNVAFEGERARIFHSVEEDRCDLTADADTPVAFVRDIGDVVADIPKYGVRRRLPR